MTKQKKDGENLKDYNEKRLLTVAHGFDKGRNKKIDIAPTLDTKFSQNWRGVILEPRCIQIGELDIKGQDCIKRVYSDEGISPTLTNMQGGNRQPKIKKDFRIRKLTPKECWRLMGFSDKDFEKAKSIPTSDTQLYKQAGNSICVKVLEKILINLLK